MKIRMLCRATRINKTVNNGSRMHPKIEIEVERRTEDILQFSDDDGETWQNVPEEYEYVEYDEDHT